jgi:hypothetical protein
MVAGERIRHNRRAQESAGEDACDDRKRQASTVEIEELSAAASIYGVGNFGRHATCRVRLVE